MLLHSIRAENFMRFEHVEITGLPSRGVVGIEGPNESGKSTLGELLVFAFFGRGGSRCDGPVDQLMRWEAQSMRVEVEFSIQHRTAPVVHREALVSGEADAVAGRRRFLLSRELDRGGTNYAKVVELPAGREVIRGNLAVEEFVFETLHFSRDDFVRSFYQDQYTSRAIDLEFLERAAGVAHLHEVMRQISDERQVAENDFDSVQTELLHLKVQAERHAMNAEKLPALRSKLEGLNSDLNEKKASLDSLQSHVDDLRSEAKYLDRRAGELEKLRGARLGVLLESLKASLDDDENLERRQRIEQRGTESGGVGAKAFKKSRDLLARLTEFVGDVARLRDEISDSRSELDRNLRGEVADGPLRRCEAVEREVTKLRSRIVRSRMVTTILVLVAFLAVAVVLRPEMIVALMPQDSMGQFLLGVQWAGGAAILLGILTWTMSRRTASRLRARSNDAFALHAELGSQKELLDSLAGALLLAEKDDYRGFVEKARTCGDGAIFGGADKLSKTYGEMLAAKDGHDVDRFLDQLSKRDRDLKARLLDTAQKSSKRIAEVEKSLKKQQGEYARTNGEIKECDSQQRKQEAVEKTIAELKTRAEVLKDEVNVQLEANRLLERTACAIRAKVEPAIRAYLKTILPRLTSGAYADVKIGGGTKLQVFSSAKSDFMSLRELSGGTREILSLALRLALSQAFVGSRVRQVQFIFLDEPFKMVDAARVISTLDVLSRLSPDLPQVFIVQPNFSESARAKLADLIETDGESYELRVRNASASNGTRPPSQDGGESDSPAERVTQSSEPSGHRDPVGELGELSSAKGDDTADPKREHALNDDPDSNTR